jgi:quinol monooxygenase YgiN
MFYLNVILTANSDADAQAVASSLVRMRTLCLAEPGCVQWEAYRSQEDPKRFVLVEHWETHAHWDAHGNLTAIQGIYLPEILPRITREVHPSTRLIAEE